MEYLDYINYPICPLGMYYEGDEDICDQSECDFDVDVRMCTQACVSNTARKEKDEVLVGCPWCAGTGRGDFDGRHYTEDNSTSVIPEENKCKKYKGVGWVCLSKLRLVESNDE